MNGFDTRVLVRKRHRHTYITHYTHSHRQAVVGHCLLALFYLFAGSRLSAMECRSDYISIVSIRNYTMSELGSGVCEGAAGGVVYWKPGAETPTSAQKETTGRKILHEHRLAWHDVRGLGSSQPIVYVRHAIREILSLD